MFVFDFIILHLNVDTLSYIKEKHTLKKWKKFYSMLQLFIKYD